MKLVIVESKYAGNVEENVAYARLCIRDCLQRGEAPFASHLLYTQPTVLNDEIPDDRKFGIDAGLEWSRVADYVVVYTDNGFSAGMKFGIERHLATGKHIKYRSLSSTADDLGPSTELN